MFRYILFTSLLMSVLVGILPQIFWLLTWIFSKIFNFNINYAPFGLASLALVSIVCLTICYGYLIGLWRVKTTYLDYKNENIPASFDGFRIVHISDLHAGTFAQHPAKLDKFVNIINSQNPDLICFTGDFVSINLTEAEGLVDNLKRMNSKSGVCSVLGNHDFFIYSREYPTQDDKNNAVDSLAMLQRKKLGWHLLRNESFVIEKGDEHITIVGVDNSNCDNQGFHTIHRGDLDKALKGTEGFKVLLSHDPSHWRGEVLEKTDIPLTLSGHTHAAQIRIFGWTPATWMFKETYGRYERQTSRGLQTLYVNIGLGGTVPLRIGANPEITVIELHRH